MNVVGRREKYGNDVLVLEAVGLDHGLHQGDRASSHLVGVVLVDRGGAAEARTRRGGAGVNTGVATSPGPEDGDADGGNTDGGNEGESGMHRPR